MVSAVARGVSPIPATASPTRSRLAKGELNEGLAAQPCVQEVRVRRDERRRYTEIVITKALAKPSDAALRSVLPRVKEDNAAQVLQQCDVLGKHVSRMAETPA